MLPLVNGFTPTTLINSQRVTIADFRQALSNKNYLEAVEVVEHLKHDSWTKMDLRAEMLSHLKKMLGPEECMPILYRLVAFDTAKDAYGLHVDWLQADAVSFQTIVNAYKRVLEEKESTSEQLLQILTRDLAEFLTYRQFTLEQAKILTAELPGFDPRKNCNQYSSRSFIDQARECRLSEELIDYLESLSPSLPSLEVDYSAIDISMFCGLPELQGCTSNRGHTPKEGLFALDTMQKIYAFIGQHPFVEGKLNFFRNEVKILVEQHKKNPQEAVDTVRESYQNFMVTLERIKARLNSQAIQILSTEGLALDHSISDGHTNVGIVSVNEQKVLCKFISSIYIPEFSPLDRVSDFVLKARLLKETVPNVVEILPHVVCNRDQKGHIQVGYFMKIENGEQLHKIQQLSMHEKEAIQSQFDKAVDAMLASGYALYDFNDDNVLWDGKALTFIDLSPAGFKPEALRDADSFSVKWRMQKFLANKETIAKGHS